MEKKLFFLLRLVNAILFFSQKFFPCFAECAILNLREVNIFLWRVLPSILFENYDQRSCV